MSETLSNDASAVVSRRDLLSQHVPGLALGAVVGSAMLTSAAVAQQPATAAAPSSRVIAALGQSAKGGAYVLAPLPYAADALEPHIDAQTMTLHHDKHHQAYVTNFNKAVASLAKLREAPEMNASELAGLTRDISFSAGGHIFHTIFWNIMDAPKSVEAGIENQFKLSVIEQYGSMENFQAHFSKVAAGVKGSGWAVAFYEPIVDRIVITDTGDQDTRLVPTAIPVLLLDVWEHAYYLKYQNKRADYIKAWWNVVNWTEVNALYLSVRAMNGK
jgi:superoxide dismutase, Fe-Mn family